MDKAQSETNGEEAAENSHEETMEAARPDPSEDYFNTNSTMVEVAEKIGLLRLVIHGFEKILAHKNGRESADYLAIMSTLNECPLRAVHMFAGFKNHFAQALADFGNRKIRAGIRHLFS